MGSQEQQYTTSASLGLSSSQNNIDTKNIQMLNNHE